VFLSNTTLIDCVCEVAKGYIIIDLNARLYSLFLSHLCTYIHTIIYLYTYMAYWTHTAGNNSFPIKAILYIPFNISYTTYIKSTVRT